MSSEEEEFIDNEKVEEEEEDFQEDDDDDEPLSSLKQPSSPAAAPASDSDDSEDDIPLAALKSPDTKKKEATKKKKETQKKKAAKAPVAKKKTKAKVPKPTTKKRTSSAPATPTKTGSSNYRSASAALYADSCRKGQLIQKLLCRWWYAIQWPDLEDLRPPLHYDALDGMPGVFIATSGSHVGQILDKRDKTKCPSFENLARKSSTELQELLLMALEGQKKALIEEEGIGTDSEKEIDKIVKWAQKIKGDAADKEATKFLKAAKVSLT